MSKLLPYRNSEDDADERVPYAVRNGLRGLRVALYAAGGCVLLFVVAVILFLAYSLVTALW